MGIPLGSSISLRGRVADGRSVAIWWLGAAALAVSAVVIARSVEIEALRASFAALRSAPLGLVGALLLYAAAFAVRAGVWTLVLPGLSFGQSLAALHVSLGANHVLPMRLGEVVRVSSVVRRAGLPLDAATASTVMLRAADVVAVVGLAAFLGPQVVSGTAGRWAWALFLPAAAVWIASLLWLRRIGARTGAAVRPSPVAVTAASVAAWVLESAVVFAAAGWAGIELTVTEAVLVTAVIIAAQVLAIAPAGIGTYEAAGTAALVALGAEAGPALAAVITAHAVKTIYALASGAIALAVPAPGLLGRLRVPSRLPARPATLPANTRAPVMLFFPAHNEAATVAGVVARAPSEVLGHPVLTLVVDDGSTDETARIAGVAGARVISLGGNRGLGAGVRAGFRAGMDAGAAAVAFCDADGEYAPEELEAMVAPILRGDADYVVGSRFAGRIDRMLPHRRLGNRLLTRLVRFTSRARVTDGQSGYRALSNEAAGAAEIVHDFNYAQVLTLDLIAKGFRYAEVPISYNFRTTGKSFVRPVRYLRKVLPAVYRELNA
jgi:uncharacterized membrane protein YbhN (UPF0104 family)